LAAPSANPFGYISPTTAEHVARQLGGQIPYILDGGPCNVGVESTIVGFEDDRVVVLRKGGVSIEAIKKICGSVEVRAYSSSNPTAPGQLLSHYAPRVPLVLGSIPEMLELYSEKKVGVLSFKSTYPGVPQERQIVLSPSGNFAEAARRLFSALRMLDDAGLDLILAEILPEKELGRAINDRLRRASFSR
jgi:L-threonylcarbamoyladenylate synthase